MKKSKAMQLVKALRTGGYRQGKEVLVNDKDEFCCLGVACNISKTNLDWIKSHRYWYIGNDYRTLPGEIRKEFGFYSDTGCRRDGNDLFFWGSGKSYDSLADANDSGETFEAIADYIEENWQML